MSPKVFQCGPTNGSFAETGPNALENVYYCGVLEGLSRQTNAAAMSRNISIHKVLIVFMLILVYFVSPVVSTDVSADTVKRLHLGTTDLEVLPQLLTVDYSQYTSVYNLDTNITYTPNLNGTDSLQKRQQPGGIQIFTSRRVKSKGDWWSEWYPVSCCYYCDNGNQLTCSAKLGYAFTYQWSFSGGGEGGFDAMKASLGFSITKSQQTSDEFNCQWNGGSGPAQIWYQQQVAWADMERQTCEVGPFVNRCSNWLPDGHIDAPVTQSYHVGCSQGWNNVNCDRGSGQRCVRK